jgi:hypothetical protein
MMMNHWSFFKNWQIAKFKGSNAPLFYVSPICTSESICGVGSIGVCRGGGGGGANGCNDGGDGFNNGCVKGV